MRGLQIVAVLAFLNVELGDAAPRKPRLTLAEPKPSYYNTDIEGNSGAYSFGYDVFDPATGNTQFRNEQRYPNGTVMGNYGYVDPLGEARAFRYVADENGYRVISEKKAEEHNIVNANLEVSTEASITWTRPSKKKPQGSTERTVFQRRKYNNVQPPGYYILY